MNYILSIILMFTLSSVCFADLKPTFPNNSDFIPLNWIKKPVSAYIEPLQRKYWEESAMIIYEAIDKYPKEVVAKYFNKIYVVNKLKFYDTIFGGTYIRGYKSIILSYRPYFDKKSFEARVHHELSSILLSENISKFNSYRWNKGNEKGFIYDEDIKKGDKVAVNTLKKEQSLTGTSGSDLIKINSDLIKRGLLTRYSKVSLEEDFNELSAQIFTNKNIWEYCNNFPLIDQKVHYLIDFYNEIHPKFDRIYFRKINPSN